VEYPEGVRQAVALMTGGSATEIHRGLDPLTRLSFAYRIMSGAWQSLNTTTRTYTTISGNPSYTTIDFLQSCSAPITDATLTVTGPVSNPRIEAPNGAYVEYQGALVSAQSWTVACGDGSPHTAAAP